MVKNMIICANFAKKIPLKDLFSEAKAIGFEHMQFSFVHSGINDDNPILNEVFFDKAKQIKSLAFGIDFPIIHGWLPSENASESLSIYLKVKKLLNSKYIVIHSKSLTNLQSIITLLHKHPSKEFVILENVAEPDFKMGLKEVTLILKSEINLCFDTCHALESGIDINIFIKQFKDYIKAMHLSDFDGEKRHISIGSYNLNKEFIQQIPHDVIIVFEHKVRSIEEYHEVYSASLKKLKEYLTIS